MHANKSSIRTDSDQFQSGDHYVVLGVEETATSEEIKIAFRKLALQHHPDKNPDDAPNATQIFASIQRAYEILSDEQERAWYDRQKPFRTSYPVPDTEPDDATSGMAGYYFTSSSTTNWTYHSARASTETKSESSSKDYYRPGSGPGGLSTDDIRNFMIPILSDALDMYSDSSMGMFTMYRKVFQLIVQDERDHGDPTAEFPPFGFSDTPWTAKCGHVSVAPFYDVWTTFQTSKDFSWIEVAQVNESESRKKKKKARGANMKAREAAKIEYNEIVQQLAELLKEHDPRYVFRVRKTNGRGICMCARCSMIYLSYMRGRGSRPF